MGNCKSKKIEKPPKNVFEREKRKKQIEAEILKEKLDHANRKIGKLEAVLPPVAQAEPRPGSSASPALCQQQLALTYEEEELDRMRYQLHRDSDAFLLNNILLSVQFFENYEREVHQIKNNPISEREHSINEAMVRQNKHVFFADRLQECVHEHVSYQRSRGEKEPLSAPRLFVIYDNVEASEPGDTSDYSAVLDAPFYKLRIEDGKDPGYVKLKKIEVLESTLHKEIEMVTVNKSDSDDSIYSESEKETSDSDEYPYNASKGEELLQQIKTKLGTKESFLATKDKMISDTKGTVGRRYSGPIKQVSLQVTKNNISNMNSLRQINASLPEEDDVLETNNNLTKEKTILHDENEMAPRKSILKYSRRLSVSTKDLQKVTKTNMRKAQSDGNLAEDTETSGYKSNSSEAESDYGYSTITKAAIPRQIGLSLHSNYSHTSGALPDETWTTVVVKALDDYGDDDDEDAESDSKCALSPNLFEKCYYLNSLRFMANFVDNFILNLGAGLGLTTDEVNSALTQGASIYCGSKISYEIFPGLNAAWPNAANQWIIRERRKILNPRTSSTYQWPRRNDVRKAVGLGCLLVPVGFKAKRPKERERGDYPAEDIQWKIIFPSAERYLESCLAHAHVRCYLFTLALHKTYLENLKAKIGIDASHIKNHLFWECEDNYAKWPEHRLGESLRLFLRRFYTNCAKHRMPNYFVESCNEINNIPQPLLLKQQQKIAVILESPVTHVLNALKKIKYTKKEFYPKLNCRKLYHILTCKNPLRIINPSLPLVVPNNKDSSDSEDDTPMSDLDRNNGRDKNRQWNRQLHKQHKERNAQIQARQRSEKQDRDTVMPNVKLPEKMGTERRRLVLEFFIPHFIAMARSSERFDAIRQALIYLEQAQRLCKLLQEQPGGDATANEYLVIVREKLSDCQRKLANQGGYRLPTRTESKLERTPRKPQRKHRPKFEVAHDSPTDSPGISAFNFVDVHTESFSHDHMKLNEFISGEESKL